MPKIVWTNEEIDLIVEDYFAMLADELAGRSYNKTEHRHELMPHLQNRTEGSIERKHQNISAVLMRLGEDWIQGYKPLTNIQKGLVGAVERWLELNPAWLGRMPGVHPATDLSEAAELQVELPPTPDKQVLPNERELLRIVRKFGTAGRDERNRTLGRAGEKHVLEHECTVLKKAGRSDLARKVCWVSEERGDGAGYDIESFAPDGRLRLIEVKTTNGLKRTPFYITRNELKVSNERCSEWHLCRLWNFYLQPKAFELRPPLEDHVLLTATTFRASFN